ncbi:ArsR family transcriptional regulator [Citrobacter portucalensis]|uniref:ArsR family transcriptional regulator n=1 Tax=Citrobacter portucalensis TaxID=1639133 RepID=UPI0039FCAAD5
MIFREPDQAYIIPALKVLGEANRLRMLYELGRECRPVTDVLNTTGLPQTNISSHLCVLRDARFVRTEHHGLYIFAVPKLLRTRYVDLPILQQRAHVRWERDGNTQLTGKYQRNS